MVVLGVVMLLAGCSQKVAAPPPRPCQFPASYQCQPVNNDVALQRMVDDLDMHPMLDSKLDMTVQEQAKLGIELCAISLVLTGVDVPTANNPLVQRIRRIEDLGPHGGPPIDPTTVTCPVPVVGAPALPSMVPGVGCLFTDGSQCQQVNNDAALTRIQGRLDASANMAKTGIFAEEGCAIDRVLRGAFDSGGDTPLNQRWNDLEVEFARTIPGSSLVVAQASLCPGLHQSQ